MWIEFILASIHLPSLQLQQKIKLVSLWLGCSAVYLALGHWWEIELSIVLGEASFFQLMLIWELVRNKNLFIICVAALLVLSV